MLQPLANWIDATACSGHGGVASRGRTGNSGVPRLHRSTTASVTVVGVASSAGSRRCEVVEEGIFVYFADGVAAALAGNLRSCPHGRLTGLPVDGQILSAAEWAAPRKEVEAKGGA